MMFIPNMVTFPPLPQGHCHYLTASKNITISNVLEMSGHLCCCGSTSPCRMPHPPKRQGTLHWAPWQSKTTPWSAGKMDSLAVPCGSREKLRGETGRLGTLEGLSFSFTHSVPRLTCAVNRVNQQTQDPHAKASLQSYSISHWVKIW